MNNYIRNNFAPAIIWTLWHVLFVHWSYNALGGLIAFRGLLVLGFLLYREQPLRRALPYQVLVAWFSTWLPTQMYAIFEDSLAGSIGFSIMLIGSMISGLAIIELGKSFGISPAIRSEVSSGIYKFFRNPMYLGHSIAEAGILIASPTSLNFILSICCWSLYLLRSKWEENLYSGTGVLIESRLPDSKTIIPALAQFRSMTPNTDR